MIKQLKYTILKVSKILVPLDQTYFPRLRLGKYIWSRGTRILLTPSMVYFNCIFLSFAQYYIMYKYSVCSSHQGLLTCQISSRLVEK